mmetsp:Transcript_11582/g.25080  ORF Transcript_11582/g.25080 Transcript_11582/m.25080 type:complete len:153 (-) Transcript_11582:651-1109(-)
MRACVVLYELAQECIFIAFTIARSVCKEGRRHVTKAIPFASGHQDVAQIITCDVEEPLTYPCFPSNTDINPPRRRVSCEDTTTDLVPEDFICVKSTASCGVNGGEYDICDSIGVRKCKRPNVCCNIGDTSTDFRCVAEDVCNGVDLAEVASP